jgi:hypothetical protein
MKPTTRNRKVTKLASLLFIALNGLLIFNPTHTLAQESQEVSSGALETPNSTLLYVSDHLAFIGEDNQGHVALALSTNRGRDGESYQAEHFVQMHDEQQGWINVEGNGQYNNVKKELLSIPNSQAFQFKGTPKNGLTIISQSNHLTLTVEPIPERISQADNGGQFWIGSAPATMEWRDRTLKGRVIYEFLLMLEFNRLTHMYWELLNEFQGFYMSVDGLGDLYFHSQEGELMPPLIGKLNGFLTVHEETEHFQDLQLTTVDFSQGFGFYQWPKQWVAGWSSKNGSGKVQLERSQPNSIVNWVFGGFAMGIVRGEVTYKGQIYEVYGLVELLR